MILIILKYNVLNGLRHITLRLFMGCWKKLGLGMHNMGWAHFWKSIHFTCICNLFTSYCFNFQTVIWMFSQNSRKKPQMHRKYTNSLSDKIFKTHCDFKCVHSMSQSIYEQSVHKQKKSINHLVDAFLRPGEAQSGRNPPCSW